jgi:acyl-coenzyme A synthetase/AMP-(fatty) acid ligase
VAPGLSKAEILRALRRQIDPAFLPRPLILVQTLPRNRLGKLPRAALLQLGRRPNAS